jgi:hypothetical protein
MIPETSSVIRKLAPAEISFLTQEMQINSGLWMKHPMKKNALDSGETMVLNWVTKIKGNYQLQWTFKEKFPQTWAMLQEIAGTKQFGKVYWHCLTPGTEAKPHNDGGNPYIADKTSYKRLNIFLDIPDGIKVYLDENLTDPVDNSSLEYTIFDIAATKTHAVTNFTNHHFYAMVIDILNDRVPVYEDLYTLNQHSLKNGWQERLS